jgi:phosphate:Na+ symporter
LLPSVNGLLSLIGGLGLFLYAISRFGSGVQKIAGEKIKGILETQARGPLSGIFTGIGMAAALQSSFLTFGMISSLMNAGLMGLLPALWIMLGVNLGMTFTAQLMAINMGAIPFVLLFAGYILNFYGKKRSWHYFGQVIFNLALMYLGFTMFQYSFRHLATEPGTAVLLKGIFSHPWLGFLLGLSLAAVLRCSNTVVVLTQGVVGVGLALSLPEFMDGALAIIIGASIGVSVMNMIIGFDGLPEAKKTNLFHLSFNLLTGLIWLAFLPYTMIVVNGICHYLNSGFQWIITSVFQWSQPTSFVMNRWFNVWRLAMVYSLFNTAVIILWVPVLWVTSKFNFSIFNIKKKPGLNEKTFLDRRALQNPPIALSLVTREINKMAAISQEMLKSAKLAFVKGQVHLLGGIFRNEAEVDDFQEQITFYLSALLSQNSLTEAQSHRVAGLLHVVSDVERVGDHANNVANLAEKKYQERLEFTECALNEIELMFSKVIDLYSKACQSLNENNADLAKQVENREEHINKLEEELRQNHIQRLNQGKCWPGSGVVYVEMLNNLLRVSAHSANIAIVVSKEGE